MLGNLLRSNKFPEWLETAALDTLVIDASVNLAELSGGQFELTHRRGEFFVIDHADADSQRSVRTLSGGETFQASLALALALSAQLSSLAAGGAARLDSIFLDEGFGTLDEATLETVAETLENLAHGDRMVGVITHVAALAERIPVRFAVHRDQRTSRSPGTSTAPSRRREPADRRRPDEGELSARCQGRRSPRARRHAVHRRRLGSRPTARASSWRRISASRRRRSTPDVEFRRTAGGRSISIRRSPAERDALRRRGARVEARVWIDDASSGRRVAGDGCVRGVVRLVCRGGRLLLRAGRIC